MARIYRTVIQAHYLDGTLVEPSLHYQTDVPTGGDEPDPSDVAAGIWGHIGALVLACSNEQVVFDELVVSEETVPPAIGVAGAHTIGTAGTNSHGGQTLPKGLVAVLDKHTGTRSRNSRGNCRIAVPGSSEIYNAGLFSSSYLTTLANLCAVLADEIDLGSLIITQLNPVVFSRTRLLAAEDPVTFKVTSATANPVPHWLRSRMTNP